MILKILLSKRFLRKITWYTSRNISIRKRTKDLIITLSNFGRGLRQEKDKKY